MVLHTLRSPQQQPAGGARSRRTWFADRGSHVVPGLKHMWWGDVAAGKLHMAPSHSFVLHQTVLAPNRSVLDALEAPVRTALLAAVAGYLPYYTADIQVARVPRPTVFSFRMLGLCVCCWYCELRSIKLISIGRLLLPWM